MLHAGLDAVIQLVIGNAQDRDREGITLLALPVCHRTSYRTCIAITIAALRLFRHEVVRAGVAQMRNVGVDRFELCDYYC